MGQRIHPMNKNICIKKSTLKSSASSAYVLHTIHDIIPWKLCLVNVHVHKWFSLKRRRKRKTIVIYEVVQFIAKCDIVVHSDFSIQSQFKNC